MTGQHSSIHTCIVQHVLNVFCSVGEYKLNRTDQTTSRLPSVSILNKVFRLCIVYELFIAEMPNGELVEGYFGLTNDPGLRVLCSVIISEGHVSEANSLQENP